MLTWEEDVEAAALRAQGWTIAAIARHLGRDRKTIRAYLDGDRTPGSAARHGPIRSPRSPTTWPRAWPRTATCGRPRCTTRSARLAMRAATRASPARCAPVGCGRTVR